MPIHPPVSAVSNKTSGAIADDGDDDGEPKPSSNGSSSNSGTLVQNTKHSAV